jgi:hypothetical protein
MAWPLSQDYNEAIQDPAQSFSDPELRGGQPTLNALGLPMPRSGNFADVYEVHCPATGNKWAVKCFTREVPGLQPRYAAIGEHLAKLKLPFAVEFRYLEQGIRIRGQWYPILKMRWVEGLLLNEFVRGTLEKPAMLQALAQIQLRLARRLRGSHIAHGDLQHGNIILVPAHSALAVKLIDYDGMFVPALARSKSGEVGHPSYQHPQRLREGLYGADMDRFPLLLTYAAIRCLLVGGRALWDRHDNGDNLLFREQDLRNPGASALFRELWQVPEAAVHDVVGHLALAAVGPMDRVPLLDQLLIGGDVLPLSAAQEKEVTALLGPGAKVNRTAPKPTAVTATPSSVATSMEEDPLTFDFPPEPAPARRSPTVRSRSGAPGWVWAMVGGGVAVVLVIGVALGVGLVLWSRSRTDLPEQTRPGPFAEVVRPKIPSVPTAPEIKRPEVTPPPPPEVKPVVPPSSGDPTPTAPLAAGDMRRLQTPTQAVGHRCVFRADGRRLLASDGSGISCWDVDTGRALCRLEGQTNHAFNMVFTPDGRHAITGGADRSLRYWDLETGKNLRSFEGNYGSIVSLTLTPDGRRLISGHGDVVLLRNVGTARQNCTVRFWDVEKGEELAHTEDFPSMVSWLALSRDGRRGIAASEKRICLLDVANNRVSRRLAENLELNAMMSGVALSPDGRLAVFASIDGRVVLWDVQADKELRRWESHGDGVTYPVFSPNGRYLLAGSGTPMQLITRPNGPPFAVRLWDVPGLTVLSDMPFDLQPTAGLAFTPDGRSGLTVNRGGEVRMHDLSRSQAASQRAGSNPPPGAKRAPLPDEAARAEAEGAVKKQFKDDYAKTKPADRLALAGKLWDKALATNGDSTPRYVLLRETLAVATLSGDVTTALKAIDQLTQEYEIDGLELKLALLTTGSKSATTVATERVLTESALVFLDEAVAADNYEAALRVAAVAEASARRSQSMALLSRAEARTKEVREAQQELEKSKTATATLKDMPEDPDANLLLGKFLCFRKNDWDQGLPLLVKGKDVALRALSEKELKYPITPEEQRQMGDAWWDRAQAIEGTAKVPFQRRAHYWYSLCATGPEGPERAEIEKRLRQLEKQVPGLEGPLDAVDLAQVKMVGGAAHLDPGKELPTRQQFTGPIEIDVVARTEAQNLRLRAHRGSVIIFNWEGKPGELRVHRPDGRTTESGSFVGGKPFPLTPRVWYHIRWLLTETGMTVSVDGVVVFQESGRYDLTTHETIRVAAVDSPLEVRSFNVKRAK